MVFNEIAARIKALKPLSETIKKTKEESKIAAFSEEIEKLNIELVEQDNLINSLQENAPIPLTADQKSSLKEEWTQRRGILRARIELLKEDATFLKTSV
jgi:superfamily I DNA and RNA helicase